MSEYLFFFKKGKNEFLEKPNPLVSPLEPEKDMKGNVQKGSVLAEMEGRFILPYRPSPPQK